MIAIATNKKDIDELLYTFFELLPDFGPVTWLGWQDCEQQNPSQSASYVCF